MPANAHIAQLSDPATAILSATVSSSVVGIASFSGYTAELIAAATYARICAHSAPAHFSEGRAGNPSSTIGLHLDADEPPILVYGAVNIAGLRFIRDGLIDSVVTIMLYC